MAGNGSVAVAVAAAGLSGDAIAARDEQLGQPTAAQGQGRMAQRYKQVAGQCVCWPWCRIVRNETAVDFERAWLRLQRKTEC